MAMLGMQSDTQYGYFPGCYSKRDLNINHSCSIRPLSDFDKVLNNGLYISGYLTPALAGQNSNGNYFPGYCPNLNASSSIRPLSNVGKVLYHGHYLSGSLTPASAEQNLPFKEIVKQTMLQQEAMFRNQILELHRLYDRQRELMDEMKWSESHKHHLSLEALRVNPFFRQNLLESSEKKCQVSVPLWLSPACSQSSAVAERKAMQGFCDPNKTQGHVDDSECFEAKCKKVGNKILDLELPAYEYIDSEAEESLAGDKIPQTSEFVSHPWKIISVDVQYGDAKPSHGSYDLNVVPLPEGNMTDASFCRRTKPLADLNQAVGLEEEEDPCAMRGLEVMYLQDLSGKTISDFKPKPIKLEEQSAHQTNFQCGMWGHEGISFHGLPGKTMSDLKVEQEEIIPNWKAKGEPVACSNSLDLNKSESRLATNRLDNGTSNIHLNSWAEGACSEILSMSSEDNETVQDCEVSTSDHLLELSSGKSQDKRTFSTIESFESDFPGEDTTDCGHTSNQLVPLSDEMNKEFSPASLSTQHYHDFVRASIVVQALPCFTSHKSGNSAKSRKRCSAGIKSRHSKRLKSCKKLHTSTVQSRFESKRKHSSKYSNCFLVEKAARYIDLNSMSPAKGSVDDHDYDTDYEETDGVLANLDSNPAPDCKEITAEELVGEQLTGKDGLLDKTFSGHGIVDDLVLNLKEDESSPAPSLPKDVFLEAHGSPENKERLPPSGISDEVQLQTSFQSSGLNNSDQLAEVRVAAEAIILISSSEVQTWVESSMFEPFGDRKMDSLEWFARIVSSVVDAPESEFGMVLTCKDTGHLGDHLSYGIDYFEAMTLSLTETKLEEYLCTANVEKEPATCPAPEELCQPRKGRTRRGRQPRKDFQSDVLPSLASLSRHEVTEDLQAIGGLVEATRPIARRRGRPPLSSRKAENAVCVQLKQQTGHTELHVEKRSFVSWGKITRRRRGPRSPVSNPRPILGQV